MTNFSSQSNWQPKGRPKAQRVNRVSESPQLHLPTLRPDQYAIATHPAKVKVLAMGRRWGKTTLGGCLALATASQGGRVAWIVPTYKNGRPLWRWAETAVRELVKAGLCHINKADRTISFEGGGWLGIYSADNPSSILGEAFHLVIIDEAARIPEVVYVETIRPTLADFDGDIIIITTPKGKNWVWREWMRGQLRENWNRIKSWTAASSQNPNPLIQQAFEEARTTIDDHSFKQEWLAKFIDAGGEVFHFDPKEASKGQLERLEAEPGHMYVIGIDWGKIKDWTVMTVFDVTDMKIAYIDRIKSLDYTKQVDRVVTHYNTYRPAIIIAEKNAAEALIEQLQMRGLPIRPFTTTNASKGLIIQALALAFERGQIHILNHAELINELSAFESSLLPSGLTKYAAPIGMHDDCVMSLAFAWAAAISLGVPRMFFI